MYKRILVAVDGSEHSKRAARHAIYIGSLTPEATIVVIHVASYEQVRTDVINSKGQDNLHIDLEHQLAPIKNIFAETKVHNEFIVERGEPGLIISDLVNEGNFDLVIIGSRGLNSLQEMVLGSVSHKVVKRSNAPVLIIK